ncbi:PTS mannose/fructose/sorbose/N-acetylgalactosamine transporter subunit IIC [Clostridium gasigenes]|uniref:PTS system, mannose-specific IIC component n=1 Tax=Clostridium gasigenes TaxID=94869 RepID=A0A1H0VP44_9CLOT|nr:PTS sugar transporter subunit IIC [Clostridium gasigenes]MBU3089601.1 PTS sugar transporter subunit IIC [Clostridium gasigenes]MBU3106006.1 PTS sugar transporter subunit IIC [Clostridium gasigenes]MBU3137843.1 PTS sugar transporter subunit IIC [Clostridium gasigenes]SDP79846.1 PTS system, mannose-specific IIC component [Clostridium gasigenes]
MEVNIIQVLLISVLSYLGALSVPWFLGISGGWYTLSRPLVSGFLIGLILGDVSTGIIVGVAVQVVYIALVTPGGQMPQDLNAAAYIGVTLGVISVKGGATVASAVAIATAVGAVGTIFFNFMMLVNSYWNHKAIACIEKGDLKGLKFNHLIGPQITNFLLRVIPTFIVIYFGAAIAANIINLFPVTSFTMRTLTALGGMLPAVGVAILLRQVTKKDFELIYFLFGFILIAALKINMISLAIVGAFFAVLNFKYTTQTVVVAENASDEEEEL